MNDEMNFALASKVSKLALRHACKGTPLEAAWAQIVAAAAAGLNPTLVKKALAVPVTDGLACVCAKYGELLARDKPGAEVKGLWFGLVELLPSETATAGMQTPYLAGTPRFDPKDEGWPCGPVWMAEDCYAPNPAMFELSELREKHERHAWSIDTMLIEPLHSLYTGVFVRVADPALLLGPTRSRGVGCGFDSGDLNTLGTVTKDGFEPLKK